MAADRTALARLAEEIDELGRRLTLVGAELRTMRTSGEAVPQQAPPAAPAWPVPPMAPPAFTWPSPPMVQQPMPQYGMAQHAMAQPRPLGPMPAPIRRESLGEKLGKEGAGSRMLAWIGGAVTLLGIVLLLVLAIQRGWLGPLPRVLVGAGFGLALVAVGLRLHRDPAGRTGAFALAATGIAVLYLDTIAATTLYEYLPVVVGLGIALAIVVGGLRLATHWDSASLGTAVVLGCAVCAPLITQGFTPTLVTFLLAVQVATTPVQLSKEWTPAAWGAGIPPLLASAISTFVLAKPGSWTNTAAAVGAGVIGLGLAVLATHRRPADPAALSLLALAAAPTLIAALFLPKSQAVLLAAGAAAVLLGVCVALRGTAGQLAGIAGMAAAFQATVTQFDGTARTAILLAEALLLTLVAWRVRKDFALAGGLAFAAVGGMLAWSTDFPPTMIAEFRPWTSGRLAGACLVAALILAVSVALPWTASRLGKLGAPGKTMPPWLFGGFLALYGAAGVVLTASLLVFPGRTGFLVGHVLITVSWTAAALVLLVRGIDVPALRTIGLVLVGAAVLKLILFDLSALDGMARVAVFLCAGLILLAAGARYARKVAATARPEEKIS
ncbi:DUF2339 domain-containing protein [Actinokineospora xionganensis]|uniref:DUF2339 domain-containing protein n=1 Tax=Actinokineospora xionganensis TaxID=2684470 RepID=A0ABR7L822_9PSEU|nr:DUF2339 domain-containing protein [Actinokineospora xionganensis]MBC6448841.1 DUF2339 domain-containing protein [Actinokineospora xionganensis]